MDAFALGLLLFEAGMAWALLIMCIIRGLNPITLVIEKIADWICEIWHGLVNVYVLSLYAITGRKRPDYRLIAKLEQALFRDSKG